MFPKVLHRKLFPPKCATLVNLYILFRSAIGIYFVTCLLEHILLKLCDIKFYIHFTYFYFGNLILCINVVVFLWNSFWNEWHVLGHWRLLQLYSKSTRKLVFCVCYLLYSISITILGFHIGLGYLPCLFSWIHKNHYDIPLQR